MSRKYRFLINYNLKSQPKSAEVETEVESLTPDQARFFLESLHTSELPAHITDVVISKASTAKKGEPLRLY